MRAELAGRRPMARAVRRVTGAATPSRDSITNVSLEDDVECLQLPLSSLVNLESDSFTDRTEAQRFATSNMSDFVLIMYLFQTILRHAPSFRQPTCRKKHSGTCEETKNATRRGACKSLCLSHLLIF